MNNLDYPPFLYFFVLASAAGSIIKNGIGNSIGKSLSLYEDYMLVENTALAHNRHNAIFAVDTAALCAKGGKLSYVGENIWNATKIPSRALRLANGRISDRFYSISFRDECRLYDYKDNVVLKGKYATIIDKTNYIVAYLEDGGIQFYCIRNKALSKRYDNFFGYEYFGGRFQYDSGETIDNRLCVVENNGKYGLFNLIDFCQCCECIYDDILPIGYSDYYSAERDGLWTILRYDGHEMFSPKYKMLGKKMYGNQYGPYLLKAFNGVNWGFINLNGVEKIPFSYDFVSDFNNEGIAVVSTRNSKNLDNCFFKIDTHGRKI